MHLQGILKSDLKVGGRKRKSTLEEPGVEPGTFHMQSERATTALPPLRYNSLIKYHNVNKVQIFCLRIVKCPIAGRTGTFWYINSHYHCKKCSVIPPSLNSAWKMSQIWHLPWHLNLKRRRQVQDQMWLCPRNLIMQQTSQKARKRPR